MVLQVIDDLKNTPLSPHMPFTRSYDRENEEHEALLLQLWSNLKPNEVMILLLLHH